MIDSPRLLRAGAIVWIGLLLHAAAPAAMTIEEVIQRAADEHQKVTSFQASTTRNIGSGDIDVGDWAHATMHFFQENDYKWQDGKFYSEFGVLQSESTEFDYNKLERVANHFAYNGNAAQMYFPDPAELHLAKSFDTIPSARDILPQGESAIFEPYRFLFWKAGDPKYSIVLENERWEFLVESAQVVGEATVNDYQCTVIEFAPPDHQIDGVGIRTRVYFAENANFFPVRYDQIRMDTEELFKKHVVDDLTEFVSQDGDKTLIATRGHRFTWLWHNMSTRVSTMEYEIDKSSFTFNRDIPHEEFTVSLAMARTIMNWDLQKDVTRAIGDLLHPDLSDLEPSLPLRDSDETDALKSLTSDDIETVEGLLEPNENPRLSRMAIALIALGACIGVAGFVAARRRRRR